MRVCQPIEKNDKKVLVQKQFKNECDINFLVARYRKTGLIGGANPENKGQFVDTTNVSKTSFEEAFEQVSKIQDIFDALPAIVRARFRNDPAQMLNFLDNPRNRIEAEKLGLIEKKAPTGAAKVDNRTSSSLDVTGTTDTKPENTGKKRVKKTIIEEEVD